MLHAESWRRHYRGAYSDAFLDGDVVAERLAAWAERLRLAAALRRTILAEDGGLVGFAHVVLEDDRTWGALLENLHVADGHMRRGIGSRLLALTAEAAVEHSAEAGLYVWVLEQNTDAQAFYEACGGRRANRETASPPGGVASRLTGSPAKLRFAWPDPGVLLRTRRAPASDHP